MHDLAPDLRHESVAAALLYDRRVPGLGRELPYDRRADQSGHRRFRAIATPRDGAEGVLHDGLAAGVGRLVRLRNRAAACGPPRDHHVLHWPAVLVEHQDFERLLELGEGAEHRIGQRADAAVPHLHRALDLGHDAERGRRKAAHRRRHRLRARVRAQRETRLRSAVTSGRPVGGTDDPTAGNDCPRDPHAPQGTAGRVAHDHRQRLGARLTGRSDLIVAGGHDDGGGHACRRIVPVRPTGGGHRQGDYGEAGRQGHRTHWILPLLSDSTCRASRATPSGPWWCAAAAGGVS